MARSTSRQKSPIAEAVVQLRTKLGESQQAFSNRLGLAIQTIARWETYRPPSGPILITLAELAIELGCHDACEEFVRKYFSDLENSMQRGRLMQPVFQYFEKLFRGFYLVAGGDKAATGNPEIAALILQQMDKAIEWRGLLLIKQTISELQSIGNVATQRNHDDPVQTLLLIKQMVHSLQSGPIAKCLPSQKDHV